MRFVTVSELRADASKIVSEIESGKEEVVITKKGKPVVLMRFIEEDAFELKQASKEGKDGKL
ncbi:MAG: type II toxin-antitoxin system Phd/YefM family antitoxin [Nitrospiria bacterium]